MANHLGTGLKKILDILGDAYLAMFRKRLRGMDEKDVRGSARLRVDYAISTWVTLLSLSDLISRMGGWPKNRPYSRLNWLTLSYPTS